MPTPEYHIGSLWHSDDLEFPQSVRIVGIFPSLLWGRYILYRMSEFYPDKPLCTHESLFKLIYTPAEYQPCAPTPAESYYSKTSLPWAQRFSSGLSKLWNRITHTNAQA